MSDGFACPTTSPAAAAAATGIEADGVLIGWTVDEVPWVNDLAVDRSWTVSAGRALTGPLANGVLRYLPVPLSLVEPMLLERALRPALAVVAGRRTPDGLVFGPSVGWAHAAANLAHRVVVELESEDTGFAGPPIPGHVSLVIERGQPPPRAPLERPAPPAVQTLVAIAAELIPARSTIQFGPGLATEGVVDALRVPMAVRSGVVTDALVRLARRGLLVGSAEAAYAWGGDRLARLTQTGQLRLEPVSRTHNRAELASVPGFVSINTALQVGLDGSVNVERVGPRLVAGVGGHPDFCAAGSRSVGGHSMIVVPASRNGRSSIVHAVEVVSTPGTDVDVVVTEHGAAWLRGLDPRERAQRLISIAAPEHRAALQLTAG